MKYSHKILKKYLQISNNENEKISYIVSSLAAYLKAAIISVTKDTSM